MLDESSAISRRPLDLSRTTENARSRPFNDRRRRRGLSLFRSMALVDLDRADDTAESADDWAVVVLVGGRPGRGLVWIGGGSSRSGLNAWSGERALCRGMRGEPSRGASIGNEMMLGGFCKAVVSLLLSIL